MKKLNGKDKFKHVSKNRFESLWSFTNISLCYFPVILNEIISKFTSHKLFPLQQSHEWFNSIKIATTITITHSQWRISTFAAFPVYCYCAYCTILHQPAWEAQFTNHARGKRRTWFATVAKVSAHNQQQHWRACRCANSHLYAAHIFIFIHNIYTIH